MLLLPFTNESSRVTVTSDLPHRWLTISPNRQGFRVTAEYKMAATTLLTAEQFLELPSSRWAELIDGVVIEMSPPGGQHGWHQARVIRVLGRAEESGAGYVCGELGCVIRRRPDAVRAADVAFIRRERVGPGGIPRGFWEGAPDLAVEIVSPYDRPGEIQTKIREWIEAGALQVWVLYGETRTVHLVRSLLERVTLTGDEVLEGGDAVPGFSCRVSELFDP
jgi:Uma2 family endonuclease